MNLTLEDDILISLAGEAEGEMAYFDNLYVLGSKRVRQMTKTYNDVEAVSRLLLDREKDLEMAAKIGKTLLERNRELQLTNELLEERLNSANDQVTQLKHDLQQKVNLLQMVTDEEYDRSSTQCDDLSNLTDLQKKLKLLEEENSNLKLEANHLKSLTESLEEREQQLISDCVRQLSESSAQLGTVSTQLSDKSDALMKQQSQISNLLAEVNQLHQNEAKLCADAEELRCSLYAARETQAELSQELVDLQERYAEVSNLLCEAKEEIKNLREQKDVKSANLSSIDSLYGSLASELEASASSHGGQKQFTEGSSSADDVLAWSGTVTSVSQKVAELENSSALAVPQDPQSPRSLSLRTRETLNKTSNSTYDSSASLAICLQPTGQSTCSIQPRRLGVPGLPGTDDLENAIHRLTLRHQAELRYRQRMFDRYLHAGVLATSETDAQLASCCVSAPGHSTFDPLSSSYASRPERPHCSTPVYSSQQSRHRSGLFDRTRFYRMIHSWFTPSSLRPTSDDCSGRELENVVPGLCSSADGPLGTEYLNQHPFVLCSAACFVNTIGTYSYVRSQVLHPTVPLLPGTEQPDRWENNELPEPSKEGASNLRPGQSYPWKSFHWNLEFRQATRFTWAASSIANHPSLNDASVPAEPPEENFTCAAAGFSVGFDSPQSSSSPSNSA